MVLCVGCVSHHSLIIYARTISLLGCSYHIIRGVLLEVIGPGYSSRQLRICPPVGRTPNGPGHRSELEAPGDYRILPPCGSGICPGHRSELLAPGDYRNFNPLRVNYYLICRVVSRSSCATAAIYLSWMIARSCRVAFVAIAATTAHHSLCVAHFNMHPRAL